MITYSLFPTVQNPNLARVNDLSALTLSYEVPQIVDDGVNLIGTKDYPALSPRGSETRTLGAGFSDLIVEATFKNRRGKNRGRLIVALGLSGVGTEHIVEVIPNSSETVVTLFSDVAIDRIRVENQTEDGYSCSLNYGQGSMVATPASSSIVSVSNYKDLVNEIITNNNQSNNSGPRIVGPNPTP